MLEIASRLTFEHLDAAKGLLNKGLPENATAAKLGIPYGNWKYWKTEARKIRSMVQKEVDLLREEGFLAKDGTILGFAVIDKNEDTLYRAESKEDALLWIEKNGLFPKDKVIEKLSNPNRVVSIEDETKDIEELVRIKTELDKGSIKILTLLEICESCKAYIIDEHIDNIRSAGKVSWQASAWFLERTDREHFGKTETIRHEGGIGLASVELNEDEESQFKANLAAVIGGNFGD